MTWYRINKNALWKMNAGAETASERVTAIKGATTLSPANMVPDNLVVDWESADPMIVSSPTPPKPTIKARSPACDALVRKWEGYHRALPGGGCEAYPDPAHGWDVATIGFGTTRYNVVAGRFGRADVRKGDTLTRAEAEMELDAELDHCQSELANGLTAPVTQAMFDALVSFAYNLGIDGASVQIDRVNAGRYEECARSFDLYVNANGRPLPGLINRRNEEEALFRSLPFPSALPPAEPPKGIARLTATGANHADIWAGLSALKLVIGEESFSVASGARVAQTFRRPTDPRSTPGCLEPIPQGRYAIGDIEFANGKDNYEGSWGAGLGPVWVALDAEFSDDRGSFGFHHDHNIGSSPGSAGCVVFRSVSDLKRFVAALRKHDPKTLVVDWGL